VQTLPRVEELRLQNFELDMPLLSLFAVLPSLKTLDLSESWLTATTDEELKRFADRLEYISKHVNLVGQRPMKRELKIFVGFDFRRKEYLLSDSIRFKKLPLKVAVFPVKRNLFPEGSSQFLLPTEDYFSGNEHASHVVASNEKEMVFLDPRVGQWFPKGRSVILLNEETQVKMKKEVLYSGWEKDDWKLEVDSLLWALRGADLGVVESFRQELEIYFKQLKTKFPDKIGDIEKFEVWKDLLDAFLNNMSLFEKLERNAEELLLDQLSHWGTEGAKLAKTFEEAAILTIDGRGESTCTMMSSGSPIDPALVRICATK